MSMRLPIADRMSRAREASEQAFVRRMQEQTDTATGARIDQLLAGYKDLQAADAARIADLNAAVDTVRAAIEVQTTAAAELRELVSGEALATQQVLAENTRDRDELLARVDRLIQGVTDELSELLLRLQGWAAEAAGSAGGRLAGAPAGEFLPRGYPWATGDIRWSVNDPPPGWLECDGSLRPREAYPQLAEVLGDTFGDPVNSALFRLPSKAQIAPPGLVSVPHHARVRAWIRM